ATGAAAHALGAVGGGLDQVDAGQVADHVPRRHVDVVVAAQVAGVVVHDALLEASLGEIELALVDEPLQELRVVDHLVVATELRVLVHQRVEAVGALGDDLLHAHAVERLDVLHGEHLEDVLVARTAGGVAGAVLLRSEDGEVDAGPLHELGHGLGDLLILVVEAAGATDPVEELVVEGLGAVEDRNVVDLAGPRRTVGLAHAPRVAGVLHAAVGASELGREV